MMSVFAGHKLRKKDATVLENAEDVVNNAKVVAIYFSAHWCPPCKAFTPKLKSFYEEVSDDLLIIFVSSDKSAEAMESYFQEAHGDYYAVPFDNFTLTASLKKACSVSGIPMLCIVNKYGEVVDMDGRKEVTNQTAGNANESLKKWELSLKANE